MQRYSLVIYDILEYSRVKLMSLDEDVSFEERLVCLACGGGMQTAVVFREQNSDRAMRFGICDNCGYMGYIDCPCQEWMMNYYNDKWDQALALGPEEIKKRARPLRNTAKEASRYLAFSLASQIRGVDKTRLVCDIGCGYGEALYNFSLAGFNNLIGVENSRHRAELISQTLGLKTIWGNFEGDTVQNQLASYKPVGLFFSHHVLEHVYNPAEVVAKASALQKEGDYFVISLPNAAGEHINYALFYLAHLHSFTKEALELVLNKNSYEVVADHSPDETNIIVAARKVSNPKKQYQLHSGSYFDNFKNRVKKGLALDHLREGGRHSVSWRQTTEAEDKDWSVARPAFGVFFKKMLRSAKAGLGRFTAHHEFVASLTEKKEEIVGDLFLTIIFNKGFQFMTK